MSKREWSKKYGNIPVPRDFYKKVKRAQYEAIMKLDRPVMMWEVLKIVKK